MSDTTQPKRVVGVPFKSGNPGRPKGSRNKLSEDFLDDMCKAWEQHGANALNEAAISEPVKFVQVAASLLPKHVEHKHVNNKNEEDILARLKELDTIIGNAARERAASVAVSGSKSAH